MLLYINRDQLAENLCKELNEFLVDINKSKREIWPPKAETSAQNSDNSNEVSPMHNLPNLTLGKQ